MHEIKAVISPKTSPRTALTRAGAPAPVSAGGLSLAHTGELVIRREIRSLLGAYSARVKGNSDGEVLFWQVRKMMDAYGSPGTALEMALDEMRTVWISCRADHPGARAPYRGLSLFLASPDSVAVLCGAPGAAAWRAAPGETLFSTAPAGPGWKPMEDAQIACARLEGGRVKMTFRKVAA